jgi:hypothetical protein
MAHLDSRDIGDGIVPGHWWGYYQNEPGVSMKPSKAFSLGNDGDY